MRNQKAVLFISLLIVALGIGGLLNALEVIPSVNWFWSGGLGACGALILIAGGINQLTIIAGPFLMVASVLSVLRQAGRLSTQVEFPALFVTFGLLLFLAYILPLELPKYLQTRSMSDDQK